jgi:MYXO-CTERM domain-containing protein
LEASFLLYAPRDSALTPRASTLSQKDVGMLRTKFASWIAMSLLTSSLLLLPLPTSTLAQTTTPTPEPRRIETRDDGDNTGLWGLLGLAGLLGLMGLRRRPEYVRATGDPSTRSRV